MTLVSPPCDKKREVAAFPRYSLNFEATGAREAEENEGEDFGREGGDIRVTRGGETVEEEEEVWALPISPR